MNSHKQGSILTFKQLSQKPMPINKEDTIGVIIDCSGIYFDYQKKQHCRKIKLIDKTFNSFLFNPYILCSYLTVFCYSNISKNLPNPKTLGDIMYLRRFKFKMYNGLLQAFNYRSSICDWYLIRGGFPKNRLDIYDSSKQSYQLQQQEYQIVIQTVKSLLNFSEQFLKEQSIISLLPSGIMTKEKDIIVKVISKIQEGYIIQKSSEDIFLRHLPSLVDPPCLAKLRSIVQFKKTQQGKEVVCNKYSSLIQIFDWSYDAKKFQIDKQYLLSQQQNCYTCFSTLMSVSLSTIRENALNLHIINISPRRFVDAIQYYNHSTKSSSKFRSFQDDYQPIQLIYNMTFMCMDNYFYPEAQLSQIKLFSVKGKGANLVKRIKLSQIGSFTSFVQQQTLFKEKIDQLLRSRSVRMKIEVVVDQTGNRQFRMIEILQIC